MSLRRPRVLALLALVSLSVVGCARAEDKTAEAPPPAVEWAASARSQALARVHTWKLSRIDQGRELVGYGGDRVGFRARIKHLGGDRFLFEIDTPRSWSVEIDQRTHRRSTAAGEIPFDVALGLAASGVDAALAQQSPKQTSPRRTGCWEIPIGPGSSSTSTASARC